MTSAKSVSLYFTEGASDKEYHIHLVAKNDGWIVNFGYGRRGSVMKLGTKTESPVSYELANATYEDLLKKQNKKGYTTSDAGTPYQDLPDGNRVSGISLQLLNIIDESHAQRLLKDDLWVMQQKHDGVRMATRRSEGGIQGINRRGLVTPLPTNVVNDLEKIAGDWVLDGELVGELYFVFDVLSMAGRNLCSRPYSYRASVLDGLDFIFSKSECLAFSKVACTTVEKQELYMAMVSDEREGVVFKLAGSPYEPGRPSSGGTQLKRKFIESASVIVLEKNADRRSVLMGLYNEQGTVVKVGNCTIPANHGIPEVGSIAEVSYLYAFDGGSIFQPIWAGVRTDIPSGDCKISQLKFKPEAELKKKTQHAKP